MPSLSMQNKYHARQRIISQRNLCSKNFIDSSHIKVHFAGVSSKLSLRLREEETQVCFVKAAMELQHPYSSGKVSRYSLCTSAFGDHTCYGGDLLTREGDIMLGREWETKPEKCISETTRAFTTAGLVKHWSSLTKETINSPLVALLKWRLDRFLEDKL